jgi:hypothetical protein
MSTLAERLKQAMGAEITRTDLADAIKAYGGKISRAAMSKWFDGRAKEMKAIHVFPVARRCSVNPEWLATGHGHPKPPKHGVSQATERVPQAEIAFVGDYLKLSQDIRKALRALVDAMAVDEEAILENSAHPRLKRATS